MGTFMSIQVRLNRTENEEYGMFKQSVIMYQGAEQNGQNWWKENEKIESKTCRLIAGDVNW